MAQADEFNYLLAKTAWMSAGKYLLLVKKLIENCKAKETGNLDGVMNEGRYKDYASKKGGAPEGHFDARSLIPFIYSLYNSVEQLLLAYYYAGFPDKKLTFVPTFERLEERFDDNDLAKDEVVTTFIHKYSHDSELPELLHGLLTASDYSTEHLKQTRRALENNNLFNVLDQYEPYYYTKEEGVQFFSEVDSDAQKVLDKINILIADTDDDGNVGDTVRALKVS